MKPPPGVWVTGPSRSGTSMVAGLLARHGVFWGEPSCRPLPDEFNPRGYFEHGELTRRLKADDFKGWPADWWTALEADGWDGKVPWGVKRGPRAWPWVRQLPLRLIVVTQRPHRQVKASRARWKNAPGLHGTRLQIERIQEILEEADCPVVRVKTDKLIHRKYRTVKPVFKALGVPFDRRIAARWINPHLWNRGKG